MYPPLDPDIRCILLEQRRKHQRESSPGHRYSSPHSLPHLHRKYISIFNQGSGCDCSDPPNLVGSGDKREFVDRICGVHDCPGRDDDGFRQLRGYFKGAKEFNIRDQEYLESGSTRATPAIRRARLLELRHPSLILVGLIIMMHLFE